MYSPHRDKSFGATDVPLEQLPADFRGCISQSASGKSSANCDAIVGFRETGYGYCALDKYKDMTYCACVNAGTAVPECVFGPCADNANAYKTTTMQTVLSNAGSNCPNSVNCALVRSMGGSSNVASGVAQPSNCYGFLPWISEHLTQIVLVLILVAIVAVLLGYHLPARRAKKAATTPGVVASGTDPDSRTSTTV